MKVEMSVEFRAGFQAVPEDPSSEKTPTGMPKRSDKDLQTSLTEVIHFDIFYPFKRRIKSIEIDPRTR